MQVVNTVGTLNNDSDCAAIKTDPHLPPVFTVTKMEVEPAVPVGPAAELEAIKEAKEGEGDPGAMNVE